MDDKVYQEMFARACRAGNADDAIQLLRDPDTHLDYYRCKIVAYNVGTPLVLDIFQQEFGIPTGEITDHACTIGRLEILKFFLVGTRRFGACIERGFDRACCYGQLEIMKYLIGKGADTFGSGLNAACGNPRYLPCATFERVNTIKYLLSVGTFREDELVKAFEAACQNGFVNTVQVLLDYGVNGSSLAMVLSHRKCRYLAVFKFRSVFCNDVIRTDEFKEAVHELCGVFLALQEKGIPNEIIRDKIFAYL
jgi:hypothetical protein